MQAFLDAGLDAILIAGGTVAAMLMAASLLWFFIASAQRHVVVAAYILIAFLFDVFIFEPPFINLGLQLYPNDLLSIVIVVCMAVVLVQRPIPIIGGPVLLWWALGAVLLMSLGLGIAKFGKAAGTEVRDYFYYWLVGLFFALVPFSEDDLKKLARWLLWGAYGLIGIAVYRWIGWVAGYLPEKLVADIAMTSVFRSLPSHAALYLAAAGLVQGMAWLRGTGTKWSGWHALVFTAFIIILQHRSVWAAYMVGAVYLLIQERQHLPRRVPLLVGFIGLAGVALGVAAAFGLLDHMFETLAKSVESVTSSRSSVTDRVFGWESLVVDWSRSSPFTIFFGFPYGTGWRRVIDGRIIEFSPHNFYVDLLMRVGLVGVVLMVIATVIGLVHCLRWKTKDEAEYLTNRSIGLVLMVVMVYYIPYIASNLHGGATGLALALMWRHHREAVRKPFRTTPLPPPVPAIPTFDVTAPVELTHDTRQKLT